MAKRKAPPRQGRPGAALVPAGGLVGAGPPLGDGVELVASELLTDVELAVPDDRGWVDALLRDWLATKAQTTLDAYRRDMAYFALFLYGDAGRTSEALGALLTAGEAKGHRVVLAYKAHMMQEPVWRSDKAREAAEPPLRHGLAPRTVNRRLAALRSITRLARVGWRLDVQGIKVAAIKDTSGVPRDAYLAMVSALEREAEQAQLDSDADGHLRALRDLAVLHLMHDLALRISSVRMLDLADVDLVRRVVRVVWKGAGDEKVPKPCPAPTRKALKRYMDVRGREPGPLFQSMSPRTRGKRPHRTSYNKLLIRIVELANQDHANPHKFRHTAITRALDKGASIRDVAAFSGHTDIRTVIVYDDRRGVASRKVADLVSGDDDDDS